MPPSIDGNRTSSTASTQISSADSTAATSKTDAQPSVDDAAACSGDVQSFFEDSWERACSEGEDFMSQAASERAKPGSGAASGGESVSLLELQAQSAAAPEADKFADNPMADPLRELLGDADLDFEDIRYCTDSARAFGPINRALTELSSSERASLAAIIADPDEGRAFFREALQGRSDIPDEMFTDRKEHLDAASDALLEEVQTHIAARFEERVAGRVRHIVRKASEPYQAINASSETRRAFLGQLAQLEGDAQKLEQRLTAFGLDEDAAGDIAQVLSEVHGDPQALEALLNGEEGPDRAGVHLLESGNAFAFAEEVLQEELGDKLGLLKQFSRQAGNGQVTHSLLTNDNFKTLRDQVLSEMEGGKGGPIEKVIADYTGQVESDETVTDIAKIVVSVITGVGVTVMTAGLGGAAALAAATATGAAEAAPDLLVAFEDVDLAEMAAQKELVMPDGTKVTMGMTDDASVEKARHNRNVTAAFAMAGLVLGAAPAIKDLKGSAVLVDDALKVAKVADDAAEAGRDALLMGVANKLVEQ